MISSRHLRDRIQRLETTILHLTQLLETDHRCPDLPTCLQNCHNAQLGQQLTMDLLTAPPYDQHGREIT